MRLKSTLTIHTAALIVAVLTSMTFGQTSLLPTVGSRSDANTNLFASGSYLGISPSSGQTQNLGNWILNTSVESTEFDNDGLVVGPDGIQYTMINNTKASNDINEITFTTSLPQGEPQISITQSPYNNEPALWNGGQFEASRMQMFWSGGGTALIADPDNQIAGFETGSQFASGATIPFTNQVYNDEDSWEVTLPVGVDSIRINWSSQAPVSNSDLTREWVTFNVTSAAVPEPSGLGLALSALFGLGFIRRR